jgi:hypothetical protein
MNRLDAISYLNSEIARIKAHDDHVLSKIQWTSVALAGVVVFVAVRLADLAPLHWEGLALLLFCGFAVHLLTTLVVLLGRAAPEQQHGIIALFHSELAFTGMILVGISSALAVFFTSPHPALRWLALGLGLHEILTLVLVDVQILRIRVLKAHGADMAVEKERRRYKIGDAWARTVFPARTAFGFLVLLAAADAARALTPLDVEKIIIVLAVASMFWVGLLLASSIGEFNREQYEELRLVREQVSSGAVPDAELESRLVGLYSAENVRKRERKSIRNRGLESKWARLFFLPKGHAAAAPGNAGPDEMPRQPG